MKPAQSLCIGVLSVSALSGCVEFFDDVSTEDTANNSNSECTIEWEDGVNGSLAVSQSCKALKVCTPASPQGFNPSHYISGDTFDASSRTLFNRLVRYDRGTTELEPGLAESWDVSGDALTYTFHLRDDVAFHSRPDFEPSRPLNADDVVFTFERMMDTTHDFHDVGGGDYPYFGYMGMGDLIDSVTAVDDNSVRFTLSEVNATFLPNLTMDFASIQSAEYAEAMATAGTPERVDQTPIGTGPFKLAQYQPGEVVRYLPHDAYWEGKTPVDLLEFIIEPDDDQRLTNVKNGSCHHMAYPPTDELVNLEQDDSVTVLSQAALNVGYLAFNTDKTPFDNVNVRRALNHATDRAAILSTVYQSKGQLATNPIPPTMWSHNDDVTGYAYDPTLAKQMLTDAGYGDGFETELWVMPVQRPYNPDADTMATMIQDDWADVGVTVTLVDQYDWGEYLDRTLDGEHSVMMLGWTGDNGDPDNFLNTLLSCDAADSGGNRAFWCNPNFDSEVNAALETTDIATRTDHYEQAQQYFNTGAPWVPLAHSVQYEVIHPDVTGYVQNPMGWHDFYGVGLAD
ncbi:ABC transporter substrate-binding protein [Saccharospirillum salsuginis]|uniref:ABC transporter substrate-binding protein n=1 Tax=Saccharospirillum salsuginis TaxID=418750 RepID=A0A918NKF5_9GAMM|nr:ABC transporter substrate-binding protein [Saccharospirillum salsuginis]GGX75055.1 ABC transporter substrate-binding protein [Saccharospirillum salsuginis]